MLKSRPITEPRALDWAIAGGGLALGVILGALVKPYHIYLFYGCVLIASGCLVVAHFQVQRGLKAIAELRRNRALTHSVWTSQGVAVKTPSDDEVEAALAQLETYAPASLQLAVDMVSRGHARQRALELQRQGSSER
jgi:hypothetical protein